MTAEFLMPARVLSRHAHLLLASDATRVAWPAILISDTITTTQHSSTLCMMLSGIDPGGPDKLLNNTLEQVLHVRSADVPVVVLVQVS